MIETVFDIEADNLLDKITRVHVVSYVDTSMEEPKSLFDYDKIVEFFAQDRYTTTEENCRYSASSKGVDAKQATVWPRTVWRGLWRTEARNYRLE
jgi:hypothetical protein